MYNYVQKANSILFYSILLLNLFSCTKSNFEKESIFNESYDVSQDMALKVANNFVYDINNLDNKSSFRKSNLNNDLEVKSIDVVLGVDNLPSFYIINYIPSGFVIVSALKNDEPIIGFSSNNTFDVYSINPNNEGLYNWVNERKLFSKYLRNNKTDSINTHWDFAAPPVGEEETVNGGSIYYNEGPLLNTSWGQGCGYNDLLQYCQTGSCNKVPAGCVAVAVGQVMKYWEYPNTYSWSSMSGGSSETSRLLRDIGIYVNMSYNCSGSGAYTSDAKNVLVNNFGYSSYAFYGSFNTRLFKIEIDNDRPVILRGEGNQGGHAWVADGYRQYKYITIHNPGTNYEYESYTYSSLYIHMNWGWSGSNNGWFLSNDFTPGSYNFNTKKEMIYRLYPN